MPVGHLLKVADIVNSRAGLEPSQDAWYPLARWLMSSTPV